MYKKLKRSSEGELKKMYPELSRRVPCIWTRQIFIRSIGYVFVNEIHEFINRQSKV